MAAASPKSSVISGIVSSAKEKKVDVAAKLRNAFAASKVSSAFSSTKEPLVAVPPPNLPGSIESMSDSDLDYMLKSYDKKGSYGAFEDNIEDAHRSIEERKTLLNDLNDWMESIKLGQFAAEGLHSERETESERLVREAHAEMDRIRNAVRNLKLLADKSKMASAEREALLAMQRELELLAAQANGKASPPEKMDRAVKARTPSPPPPAPPPSVPLSDFKKLQQQIDEVEQAAKKQAMEAERARMMLQRQLDDEKKKREAAEKELAELRKQIANAPPPPSKEDRSTSPLPCAAPPPPVFIAAPPPPPPEPVALPPEAEKELEAVASEFIKEEKKLKKEAARTNMRKLMTQFRLKEVKKKLSCEYPVPEVVLRMQEAYSIALDRWEERKRRIMDDKKRLMERSLQSCLKVFQSHYFSIYHNNNSNIPNNDYSTSIPSPRSSPPTLNPSAPVPLVELVIAPPHYQPFSSSSSSSLPQSPKASSSLPPHPPVLVPPLPSPMRSIRALRDSSSEILQVHHLNPTPRPPLPPPQPPIGSLKALNAPASVPEHPIPVDQPPSIENDNSDPSQPQQPQQSPAPYAGQFMGVYRDPSVSLGAGGGGSAFRKLSDPIPPSLAVANAPSGRPPVIPPIMALSSMKLNRSDSEALHGWDSSDNLVSSSSFIDSIENIVASSARPSQTPPQPHIPLLQSPVATPRFISPTTYSNPNLPLPPSAPSSSAVLPSVSGSPSVSAFTRPKPTMVSHPMKSVGIEVPQVSAVIVDPASSAAAAAQAPLPIPNKPLWMPLGLKPNPPNHATIWASASPKR